MVEPWFDPNLYAWIPGALLGVIGGGIGGPLIGTCASRGKHKSLVFAFLIVVLDACAALLAAGLFAWSKGQPYGVWYGLGFPGLLGFILFGALTPLVWRRFREAETRKGACNPALP
jgi:hypothetical protein